jgi:hypothetical protein
MPTGIYYITSTPTDLTGAEARRQLDLFINREGTTTGLFHRPGTT